ncbi:MAG TPA: hypothetical protein VKC35_06630 [Vicinamibacterales bacterium]|nr:hypothetical protein [Vicinamibacterales bacterium]
MLVCFLALASIASAQTMPNMPGMQHAAPATPGWHGTADASVFFGFNDQERKFRDFQAWESQNWLMGDAVHPLARGTFHAIGMLSLEPFTLHRIGSPQVFQTGETFRSAPLKDFQHPHDLIMGLGADYTRTSGAVAWYAGADLVGSPTLGPPPFMHRPSAYGNPQAPLAHHFLDSTHITPGVVRGGIDTRGVGVEGSWFHGHEPDEDRTDIDLGALDSYAMRLSWAGGPWSTQASAARLKLPEAITPYDADRLTGSISYTLGPTGSAPLRLTAFTFAFGQNREIHGNFEAYLFEATIEAWPRGLVYTRAESADKDILDAGFHPRGVFHRHRHSQVGALTAGYLFTLLETKAGRFEAGADVTAYSVPQNLQDSYGSPSSYHVFVHYSLRGPSGGHVH